MAQFDDIAVAEPHHAARPLRLGRRLVWMARLLILWPAWNLWWWLVDVLQVEAPDGDQAFLQHFLLTRYGLNTLAWLCLPAAGLMLLHWRKPNGLRTACGLIWLAPVLALCGLTINDHIGIDPGTVLPSMLIDICRAGFLHAAGFTAFLLGIPRLREAYGLRLTGFGGDPSGGAPAVRWRLSWLGLLRCSLLLPLLVFVPLIWTGINHHEEYWQVHLNSRMLVSIAFAGPPLIAVIMLGKYQRPASLGFAIAVLWLMVALGWSSQLLHLYPPHITGLPTLTRLPGFFGVNLAAAFAWTMYLTSAPDIRHRYLGTPVAEIDVDAF